MSDIENKTTDCPRFKDWMAAFEPLKFGEKKSQDSTLCFRIGLDYPIQCLACPKFDRCFVSHFHEDDWSKTELKLELKTAMYSGTYV